MGNINELLKLLSKHKRLTKVKFKEGKTLKIPSLLGTSKPKTIKPKYTSIPLAGERVHWHIAIDLINATRSKKRQFKSNIPKNIRPPKLTKEQIKAWKNYGAGVFVGHLKPHIEQYDRDYLYGYARHVISNKKTFRKEYVLDARNFIRVHRRLGAPDLTKQYFLAKYGTRKLYRLGDDDVYQQLLRLRKVVTSKSEIRQVERFIKIRKKQFSTTLADYHYVEYKRDLYDSRNLRYAQDYADRLELLGEPPSNRPFWNYIRKNMGNWLSQSAWGKEDEFIKAFYAKHEGVDPGVSIGRGREKYAYEKLIKWLIETGLEVPLHSTNLTHLKNPSVILTMKLKLAGKFSQEQIDQYIRDNLTNPENLSRSGLPDPLVDWHSLHGYFRKTPWGAYFGQDVERAVTKKLGDIETSYTKEYKEVAREAINKRNQYERDFESWLPPADIRSHLQVVIEHKKQLKKELAKRGNNPKKK